MGYIWLSLCFDNPSNSPATDDAVDRFGNVGLTLMMMMRLLVYCFSGLCLERGLVVLRMLE